MKVCILFPRPKSQGLKILHFATNILENMRNPPFPPIFVPLTVQVESDIPPNYYTDGVLTYLFRTQTGKDFTPFFFFLKRCEDWLYNLASHEENLWNGTQTQIIKLKNAYKKHILLGFHFASSLIGIGVRSFLGSSLTRSWFFRRILPGPQRLQSTWLHRVFLYQGGKKSRIQYLVCKPSPEAFLEIAFPSSVSALPSFSRTTSCIWYLANLSIQSHESFAIRLNALRTV